jgi:hypothetical protein
MKNKLMNKLSQKISKAVQYRLVWMCLIILPGIVWAQPTPPTGSGGTGGGIPDSPLSVPFDNHLAILLMAAGAVFAVCVMVRSKKILPNKTI